MLMIVMAIIEWLKFMSPTKAFVQTCTSEICFKLKGRNLAEFPETYYNSPVK